MQLQLGQFWNVRNNARSSIPHSLVHGRYTWTSYFLDTRPPGALMSSPYVTVSYYKTVALMLDGVDEHQYVVADALNQSEWSAKRSRSECEADHERRLGLIYDTPCMSHPWHDHLAYPVQMIKVGVFHSSNQETQFVGDTKCSYLSENNIRVPEVRFPSMKDKCNVTRTTRQVRYSYTRPLGRVSSPQGWERSRL